MSKEQLLKLFDEFINQRGLWFAFQDFIESKGHTLEEIGIEEIKTKP